MKKIDTEGPVGERFAAWRKKARKARAKIIQEYEETKRVPEPDQKIWQELKNLFLIEVFHGKCAYCEAKIVLTNSPADVDH